jgi:hypothetical protein
MRKFELYNEEWMKAIEDDAQLEAYYDGGGGGDDDSLDHRMGMQQELFDACVTLPCCRFLHRIPTATYLN